MCVGFWQGWGFFPDIKKKVHRKKTNNPEGTVFPVEKIGRYVGKSILLNPHIFVLGGSG